MNYELIRTKRKTVSIEVERGGRVLVRAPLFFPKYRVEKLLSEKSAWIEKQMARLKEMGEEPRDSKKEIDFMKRELEAQILPKVALFSQEFGFQYTKIRITSARKRFGSCNSKGVLCFSYQLLRFPPEAVEYVIIHELCHTKEMNHSKRFWSLVESCMPDYKEREKLLKNKKFD